MPNTAFPDDVVQYLLTTVRADIAAPTPELTGLQAAYYGDQAQVPFVPAVAFEPANVARELIATSLNTNNEFKASFLVYGGAPDIEGAQEEADAMTRALTNYINALGIPAGGRFNDLVVIGYVESIEYGYIVKGSKLMRANRGIVYCKSRTTLLEA